MVPQKASIFILITDSPEKHQPIFSCKASPRFYENRLYLWVDPSAIIWTLKSEKVVYCHH